MKQKKEKCPDCEECRMCSETRCRVCRQDGCQKAGCGLGASFTYGEYLEWRGKKSDGKETVD